MLDLDGAPGKGGNVKIKAAVLWEVQTPWNVEEIELDPPKAGEVLIKLVGSGLCHSDEHIVTGDLMPSEEMQRAQNIRRLPLVGGHEGAGEIVEVGPGVTEYAVGDRVVLAFIPSCGKCVKCSTGHHNLCDLGANLVGGQQVSDGTSRHHARGQDLALMCCIGTFGEYTVASTQSVIKLDGDIPLDKAALVGCGVTTGWGSAVYAADVQAGETVVVVGCGGVGTSAIQGAAMAGARYVVAVDPVPFKREQAPIFGATHVATDMKAAKPLVEELTWGHMAHKVIITTSVGSGEYILPAMALLGKGGRAVQTAATPYHQDDVKLNLFDLTMMEKQLVGAVFGSANPRYDIPRLLRLYKDGRLKLDELLTRTYPLEDINQGYEDMRTGKNLRGMVMHSH